MRNPMDKTTWLIARVTALILIFLLIVHIGVQHFALSINETPAVIGLLLIFALIHGGIGTRRIILDFKDYSSRFERVLTITMLLIIVIFLVIGFIVLPNNV